MEKFNKGDRIKNIKTGRVEEIIDIFNGLYWFSSRGNMKIEEETDWELESQELLFRDLCSRLPYDTLAIVDFETYLEWLPDDPDDPYKKKLKEYLRLTNQTIQKYSEKPEIISSCPCRNRFNLLNIGNEEYGIPVELIKPYLRSLSRITKDEQEKYKSFQKHRWIGEYDEYFDTPQSLDYLKSIHVDYNGLIKLGLALEAPEGMYK